METQTFTATYNKHHTELTPTRMSIYRQSKIIEAIDAKQQVYYLFFYKDTFLNGAKATKTNINSHLHKAFTNGILFQADHPLTQALLINSQPFHFNRFNQFFKRSQQKYSPQETAMIFTFFDSIIPSKEIKKLIKGIFYQYRRNGQMLASYRILRIFVDYAPDDSFGTDLIRGLQFQQYEDIYDNLEELKQKDPLYLENECFDHLNRSHYAQHLLLQLAEQERWIDELAVRTAILSTSNTSENLAEIKRIISQHFKETEQIALLKSMVAEHPNLKELKIELLEKLLSDSNHDEIVRFVVTHPLSPSEAQLLQIKNSFENASAAVFPPLFEHLNNRLIELFDKDPKALEQIMIRCVSSFLPLYNLNQIKDWLSPLNQAGIHLPIEQKLDKMKQLEDDPDHQFELGELYLYFQQLEQSLDCFKWEMELNPDNTKPVQFLSKIYLELGKKEEANAYQQLLIQMQKSS